MERVQRGSEATGRAGGDDPARPGSLERDRYETFSVSVREWVATVVLRGTGHGNAMGRAVWKEMPAVFLELDRDDSVRVVVLRGSGDCFTVGLDLRWFIPHFRHAMRRHGGLAGARRELFDEAIDMQRAVEAVAVCRKPIIAAIHGPCIGGGLDVATACDVRLASRDALFSAREVRLGIVADLGMLQRLPGIIGQGHARELALTGIDVEAARALEIGLVNRLYGTWDELFTAARDLAKSIASNPPLVVAGIKEIFERTYGATIGSAARYTALWNAAFMPSEDMTEAMNALMDDRPPNFVGR